MYSVEYTAKYFVNKEKGVVVCKLEDCFDSVIYDMHQKGWPFDENLEIPNTFTGKAKCSPEDTFNEDIGKRIALNRALIKLNTAKRRMLNSFITEAKKVHVMLENDVQKLTDKYTAVIAKKSEDIERITE